MIAVQKRLGRAAIALIQRLIVTILLRCSLSIEFDRILLGKPGASDLKEY